MKLSAPAGFVWRNDTPCLVRSRNLLNETRIDLQTQLRKSTLMIRHRLCLNIYNPPLRNKRIPDHWRMIAPSLHSKS